MQTMLAVKTVGKTILQGIFCRGILQNVEYTVNFFFVVDTICINLQKKGPKRPHEGDFDWKRVFNEAMNDAILLREKARV